MARWTDLAVWQGPTVNEGDGDGHPGEPADRMTAHIGLVLHIAQGTYAGTIAWQLNPVSEVSSHFVVARDGRIAQMVDTDDRSWCQAAGNTGWISVENEGYVTDQPTPQQVEALAQLYARGMREYGLPARITDTPAVGGLGWHGMGGAAWGGHYQCPGEGFKAARPAILARAQQIAGGAMADTTAQQVDDIAWVIDAMNALAPEIRGGRWKGEPSPYSIAIADIQQRLAQLELAAGDHKHALAAGATGPAEPV